MKRLFLTMLAMMIMAVGFAQTNEEIQASIERVGKLVELIKDLDKSCGNADIDNFALATKVSAELAKANSEKLVTIYESIQSGNGNLAECQALSESIVAEGKAVKEAGELAPKAAEGIKTLSQEAKKNPMKGAKNLKKAQKLMDQSNEALGIVTKESIAQGQIIAAMIASMQK